jgi:Outer membrane protein and related peptidoglycan-associated (lipo)proteins
VEKVNHVIIWVQNRRFRIYHKQAKVLDMPTNVFDGTKFNRLCFRLSRGASCGSYVSNIRITDASPDMHSKLLTDGKLVTYGIYFDVNKDVVKPESYGTLKGIADILKENTDVKVKIVGHTDSDGADAANMDLSKRRGASVKDELVKDFGIDASRLQSDGMGETQPIAPNDTPVNKALNRRVELIKLFVLWFTVPFYMTGQVKTTTVTSKTIKTVPTTVATKEMILIYDTDATCKFTVTGDCYQTWNLSEWNAWSDYFKHHIWC